MNLEKCTHRAVRAVRARENSHGDFTALALLIHKSMGVKLSTTVNWVKMPEKRMALKYVESIIY